MPEPVTSQVQKPILKDLLKKEFKQFKPRKKRKSLPLNPVKINIFWPLSSQHAQVTKAPIRKPASVSSLNESQEQKDSFQQDLINQYKKQQKHDEQLNELIRSLDSYGQDFNTNY